jgi:hypothetical protein
MCLLAGRLPTPTMHIHTHAHHPPPTHTHTHARPQDIFRALESNGRLVEQEMEQLYSEPLQKFLADRFVVGTCPRCKYEVRRGGPALPSAAPGACCCCRRAPWRHCALVGLLHQPAAAVAPRRC